MHITRDQQRQCVKWANELTYKDSILVVKDSIISKQREFIVYTDGKINDLAESNVRCNQDLAIKTKKLKRTRIVAGSTGIGLIGLITLLFVIK